MLLCHHYREETSHVVMMNHRQGGAPSSSGQSAGRMRIRSIPTAMDEKYVTSIWELLKKAIQEIQRKNNSGLSFEELYRNAYTMVLHKHGDRLYIGLRGVIEEHMRANIRPCIEEAIEVKMEVHLLETLISVWNDHTTAMVMIRDILMYMDRVYVSQQKVEPVYNLGLSIFKDEIIRWDLVNERLRREMLDMVTRERQGEQIDWILLKHGSTMLSALGIYEAEFEQHFLSESAQYYKRMGLEFLAENSAAEYVKRVETCIREENDRAQRYLDSSTRAKILAVVDSELIEVHMKSVVEMDGSGVSHMLNVNLLADLQRMYTVFHRVTNGTQVICQAVSSWVRQRGEEITHPENQQEELKKDPVLYITRLMELEERSETLLRDAFQEDKMFKKRIYDDFTHFINLNNHSAEYLTIFLDEKLRKGNRVLREAEIDEAVNRCMTLFRFLGEKDIFEQYYKRALAKRLLTDRSASDDSEKAMVSRLKTECGYQYTSKLENMFKDRELWNTIQAGFRDYLNVYDNRMERDPCEIVVRVLTSGVWPTQNITLTCSLPIHAEQSWKSFQDFYQKKHSGRKLTLNTFLGNADVKAVFFNPLRSANDDSSQQEEPTPSQGPYRPQHFTENHKILNVSTHQMTVLLCFNTKNVFKYSELGDATNITERELQKTMQSLSMGKASQRILVRKGTTAKEIAQNDEFYVNDSFTSKLVRIKVSTIADAKSSTPKEAAVLKERVEDDRKHEIECAIVRVMKSRKRLEHNNLLTEVLYQTSTRFKPTPTAIKQRVEALIERDYLARDKKDPKIYEYVS
ncbi:unnamed protein product, partial [Mesorhabditis belari]|uniref:Cullin family profile domain-containing protein n=1 Tax=Mesorhabditis belari TaxID=2138241 RepID=A0AAF3FIX5_9BILA